MQTYKVTVTEEATKWYNENYRLHRENGPAVELKNGFKYYYINGKFHREDGPAIENANGDKYYYINGISHRQDGPAVEWANGYKSYCINGNNLTEQEFNDRNKPCEGKIVEIDGVKYKLTQL